MKDHVTAPLLALLHTNGLFANANQKYAALCRHNEKLAVYGTTANARALMLQELTSLAVMNPALGDRMLFPQIPVASLRTTYAQR